MMPLIESLLAQYERGTVSRRELVGALAFAAVPGRLTRRRRTPETGQGSQRQDGVLRGININHVNLQVSDLERSEEFYRTLFSLPPKREVPGRPYALDLGDGLSFLSVPEEEPPGVIDHFCVGVEDFDPERVAGAIQDAGLDRDLRVGTDNVYVTDPDGIRVQISWPDWGG
jgi:catechol 2,3-dioxygenase-like lactoylglutathione lyase family enzyme